LKQNAEDGGNRKFILVEMEEKIAQDITAERVRRVAGGYTNAKGEAVEGLGMQIIDLRIKQVDLPTDSQVINDVYERMRAQRKQEAAKLRAEGEEQSLTIRAQADRDSTVLIAEAERDAQRLRGEGDADAARIYGKAGSADPAFYAFYRSLEAYRGSMTDGNGVIVLDKNDPFLQYLKSDR
jgi:membrane protease subunit HflC